MVRRERHTPPTSRFSMGVPDTAMAAETAVATMVENFIVKVAGEFKYESLKGSFSVSAQMRIKRKIFRVDPMSYNWWTAVCDGYLSMFVSEYLVSFLFVEPARSIYTQARCAPFFVSLTTPT